MQVNNFTFLSEKLPELKTLGEFAEQYVFADPPSCGVKLRTFGEELTKIIYHYLNLSQPDENNFFGLLDYEKFKEALPPTIISKLHRLRKMGNKSAHGTEIKSKDTIDILQEAHDLGKWAYITFFNEEIEKLPAFKPPTNGKSNTEWQREKSELLSVLYKKENEVDDLLKELQTVRLEAKIAKKSQNELNNLLQKGYQVADELQFNEETTRRLLIDDQLVSAGWNVGGEGKNTSEVTQEEPVDHQPTETGKGFVDYVLWDDDGKPLAVIEAKKTSVKADLGKKQAVLYADGLEKMKGHRPVIFYTNGYDIFIWNDAANEPPRQIFGFYSKDSLQYLHFQRKNKVPANQVQIRKEIADRIYQTEAIKRIIEDFAEKHRKALVAQATGTGKTRVAVSLSDALLRAKWVKRILFLCDRRELRKQAWGRFKEFVDDPMTIVSARTAKDRDKRIYFATYPAMLKIYQTFDVGFFDLLIADESHRSIYNVYGELFRYFDCLQVGLTATPVNFVNRNTYRLFERPDKDPTSSYSYEEAVQEKYLVPFEVYTHTTKFQRDGIKYTELSHEQQIELEDQVANAEEVEYTDTEVDKQIFNKDTNREILRNLMENGIKDKSGSHPGKTIIFARSHNHAIILRELFDEMYPQYGGKFCEVIDTYDPRAEQLIDDFKGLGTNDDLTIAISVDMLDTGIDVPEVVNLVFAKPIKSYVKFWQMIGRGTRLCPDLFGPGNHKTKFRIFDHWGNFEWFELFYKAAELGESKSLMQKLFESRVRLAQTALQKFDKETFQMVIQLIHEDINTLESIKTIAVREKWQIIKSVNSENILSKFEAHTKNLLLTEIAPLMSWRNIRGYYDAYDFDFLVAGAQGELLLKSAAFQDFKAEITNRVNRLKRNLAQVMAKSEMIKKVLQKEFWEIVTVESLEEMRIELRGIMQFHQDTGVVKEKPLVVDITEDKSQIIKMHYSSPNFEGLELAAYKQRVEQVLNELFEQSLTLKKIKQGDTVNEDDLESLMSMVLMQHPDIDLKILEELFPDTVGHLDYAIRRIIGLEAKYVEEHFKAFLDKHHELNANQIRFLRMLINHISKYGAIHPERLYEAPFTAISSGGPETIFSDTEVDELIGLVKEISQPYTVNKK